ncbi:hypothetical protein OG780_01270 [Streptomyces sp. NBC_00386]
MERSEEHPHAVPGEADESLDAGLPLIPPYVAPAVRLAAGELDRS